MGLIVEVLYLRWIYVAARNINIFRGDPGCIWPFQPVIASIILQTGGVIELFGERFDAAWLTGQCLYIIGTVLTYLAVKAVWRGSGYLEDYQQDHATIIIASWMALKTLDWVAISFHIVGTVGSSHKVFADVSDSILAVLGCALAILVYHRISRRQDSTAEHLGLIA